MTSVNFNTNTNTNVYQTRQNPDEYAKIYAERNGITVEEAKEELKAQYGAPKQNLQNTSIFSMASENDYYGSSFDTSNFDIDQYAFGQSSETSQEGSGIKGLFRKFLDFLKGGNGPQKEGDPQSHLNPETGEMTGPQKEGDFNPMQEMFA